MTRLAVKPRKPAQATLIRDLLLARMEEFLEKESDRTFTAWCAAKVDLPGSHWSHITDPLYHRWQEAEKALALVRCI